MIKVVEVVVVAIVGVFSYWVVGKNYCYGKEVVSLKQKNKNELLYMIIY